MSFVEYAAPRIDAVGSVTNLRPSPVRVVAPGSTTRTGGIRARSGERPHMSVTQFANPGNAYIQATMPPRPTAG